MDFLLYNVGDSFWELGFTNKSNKYFLEYMCLYCMQCDIDEST